jgi:hypothetical protein
MRDLAAAAEAVGDDQRVWVRLADGREQHALSRLHRHVVVLAGVVAERAGHPTAAGIENVEIETELRKHRLFVVQLH